MLINKPRPPLSKNSCIRYHPCHQVLVPPLYSFRNMSISILKSSLYQLFDSPKICSSKFLNTSFQHFLNVCFIASFNSVHIALDIGRKFNFLNFYVLHVGIHRICIIIQHLNYHRFFVCRSIP